MSVTISQGAKSREREIRIYIEEHSKSFDLDPNLVRALITQESRFKPEAVSPTGAYGLGQMTGIGSRQVAQIAAMPDCPDPLELENFTKRDASDPDLGVKAVCATLWWLFHKKYRKVTDKKVQLEAVLTFYNSGGKAAYLVITHGGHANALAAIEALPSRYRSQAAHYAPEVTQWYIAWHELLGSEKHRGSLDPFDTSEKAEGKYAALVEVLRLLGLEDDVDVIVDVREGLTEVTLILPGEFPNRVRN